MNLSNISVESWLFIQAGIVLFALILTVAVISRLYHGYHDMKNLLRKAISEEDSEPSTSDEPEKETGKDE